MKLSYTAAALVLVCLIAAAQGQGEGASIPRGRIQAKGTDKLYVPSVSLRGGKEESSMAADTSERDLQNETKLGCERPDGWCIHPGSTFSSVDCDGDGLMDCVCIDTAGNRGTMLSTSGCTHVYPSAGIDTCKSVFRGCQRPDDWCTSGTFSKMDCDGDGLLDGICTDTAGDGGGGSGGTCGNGDRGNGVCASGDCCSKFGWCGTSSDHCSGDDGGKRGTMLSTSGCNPIWSNANIDSCYATCGNGKSGNGKCSDPNLCCTASGYCVTSASCNAIVPIVTGTPVTPTSAPPDIIEDVPDLTTNEVATVMNWIKAEVVKEKNPFCWKQSYGRSVGRIPTECPANRDKIGLLCYSQCPQGYARFGVDCHSICPPGFSDNGLFCRQDEYGRTGYPWQWGDPAFSGDGQVQRCENDHGAGKCEWDGGFVYPKCQAGYYSVGCCICRPNPPDCAALGLGGQFDLSCAKMIIIGDPIPMVCSSTLQSDAGLCYPYCNDGFYGVGPICWQKCGDVNQADCAAACAKDTVTCVLAVVDQVIAPLIIAANIATLGMAAPITGAATVTIKTSSGATKVVSGATKLGNLLVQVVNMLQSINPANLPKGANVLTRIFESRTGTVLSKIITTAQLYSIEYKTLVQYKRAYAEDFASQTSAAINDEINRRYHSDTAQFFKQIWAELQLKELAEANAWEISSIVLAAVSVADISGVTGLVSAYAKPICKSVVPFPCIKADLTQTCK